jgi:hypothetical protein
VAKPNTPAPQLDVPLVGQTTTWKLADRDPQNFTLIVFYRGLHYSFFLQPDHIAETAYWLTQQPASAWAFEVEARPFAEKW